MEDPRFLPLPFAFADLGSDGAGRDLAPEGLEVTFEFAKVSEAAEKALFDGAVDFVSAIIFRLIF
jgi:hypothetical protein